MNKTDLCSCLSDEEFQQLVEAVCASRGRVSEQILREWLDFLERRMP